MTEDGIYARLARARAEFQENANFIKVQPDKGGNKLGGLKYPYLPVEQAKPVIERATAAQGITIIPDKIKFDEREGKSYTYEKKSKYDDTVTKWIYMTAKVKFKIACPTEIIEIPVWAEAQDNSDKCISKLYTAAYKNLVKILFGFAESPKDDFDATQEEIPSGCSGFVTAEQMVKAESKVDPKVAEQEAKVKAEKKALIDGIRWKCLLNKDMAEAVRDKLIEEANYDGNDDPDNLANFLRISLNVERLTEFSEWVDSLDGKVKLVE